MESEELKEKKNFLKELLIFLKEYSVIGLSIGVIVAQISKDLIDSLVKGILNPFIKLLVPSSDTNILIFTIKEVEFNFNIVLNALLTFAIVMTILFVVIKKILKNENLLKKK